MEVITRISDLIYATFSTLRSWSGNRNSISGALIGETVNEFTCEPESQSCAVVPPDGKITLIPNSTIIEI